MADGLLSIRDKRKHDPNTESFKETFRQTNKSTKFNHYKYVSPSLVNSSPVSGKYIHFFTLKYLIQLNLKINKERSHN
jgi:hypothetical protein